MEEDGQQGLGRIGLESMRHVLKLRWQLPRQTHALLPDLRLLMCSALQPISSQYANRNNIRYHAGKERCYIKQPSFCLQPAARVGNCLVPRFANQALHLL
jgi:hypothetical protein